VLGRRPPRRLAAVGIGAYITALVGGSLRASSEAGLAAATLPVTWATMHLSYGLGYWVGVLRHRR